MTDLELTKVCADRMGITVQLISKPEFSYAEHPYYCIPTLSDAPNPIYDPLHNDVQAMAMVKRLKLSVGFNGGWVCMAADERGMIISGAFHHETINRAIVECVASL